jgi:hypothetical protein
MGSRAAHTMKCMTNGPMDLGSSASSAHGAEEIHGIRLFLTDGKTLLRIMPVQVSKAPSAHPIRPVSQLSSRRENINVTISLIGHWDRKRGDFGGRVCLISRPVLNDLHTTSPIACIGKTPPLASAVPIPRPTPHAVGSAFSFSLRGNKSNCVCWFCWFCWEPAGSVLCVPPNPDNAVPKFSSRAIMGDPKRELGSKLEFFGYDGTSLCQKRRSYNLSTSPFMALT